jgi:hypothetical protein
MGDGFVAIAFFFADYEEMFLCRCGRLPEGQSGEESR